MTGLQSPTRGDLPALLDILTVAVTTLDAVGVENYRELYLYVMGTTGNDVVRDLRVENGQLIVGPPASGDTYHAFCDNNFEGDRRVLLIAELGNIMSIWRWSAETMASYLRCSEAMLFTWVSRSVGPEVPILPHKLVERIKRLSIIDQIRFLVGVSDQDMPRWLSRKRPGFNQRSIEELIQADNQGFEFIQLVLWSLNNGQQAATVN